MLRLAHRGDWRVAPENSIEAFLAALRVPDCDGVELDVRLSGDGVPVVIHDESLSRVQGHHGRVDQLEAEELATLGVPALAAVLAGLPSDAWLNVELKGDRHRAATARILHAARGEAPANAVVSSFAPGSLVAMADLLPGWVRWLGTEDMSPATMSLAVGLGCGAVSATWETITPASMRAAVAAGLEVAAWTVRRRPTFDRLARLGVIACCVEAAALDG